MLILLKTNLYYMTIENRKKCCGVPFYQKH